MKVTKENIKSIKYIEGYHDISIVHNILESLLIDIAELNQVLEDRHKSYRKIYIDYEDKHTEYSPERTDPCPDYYGMFTLRFENDPYTSIGDVMTLDELDNTILILYTFIEFKI